MPIRGENKGISRGTGSRAVSRPPRERGPRAVDVVEVDASSGESSESTNSDALDDDDDDVDGALERRYFDVILPLNLMTAVDIFMRPLPYRGGLLMR